MPATNKVNHTVSQLHPCLPVQSHAGWHTPPEPSNPDLTEIRNAREVGGDDSKGVRGTHKEAILAKNHITVLWEGMCENYQGEASVLHTQFPSPAQATFLLFK